jgi:hypothetical protein
MRQLQGIRDKKISEDFVKEENHEETNISRSAHTIVFSSAMEQDTRQRRENARS